jgi:hypothetical protein
MLTVMLTAVLIRPLFRRDFVATGYEPAKAYHVYTAFFTA